MPIMCSPWAPGRLQASRTAKPSPAPSQLNRQQGTRSPVCPCLLEAMPAAAGGPQHSVAERGKACRENLSLRRALVLALALALGQLSNRWPPLCQVRQRGSAPFCREGPSAIRRGVPGFTRAQGRLSVAKKLQ